MTTHDPAVDKAIRVADEPPAAPAEEYAARRGFPLPPWTGRPGLPTGRELLTYLEDVDTEDQAVAYLDALLERTAAAQLGASRCAMADHEGLVDELDAHRADTEELEQAYADREADLLDARAAVHDAYRAGYQQARDELLGDAGKVPDAYPVVAAVAVSRELLEHGDRAVVDDVVAHTFAVAARRSLRGLRERLATGGPQ